MSGQMQRSAEHVPGHVQCQSCGYTGHPVLGDGTGANCAACGSYSVQKPTGNRPAPAYPDNSRDITERSLPHAQPRVAAVDNHERDVEDLTHMCASGDHDACEDFPDTQCLCQCHDHYGVPDKYKTGWEDDQYHPAPFDRSSGPHPGHFGSKQATTLHPQAQNLQPGDMIRLPSGKTQKVMRIRPHETSGKHVYIDTDGGTSNPVLRSQQIEIAPQNSQQQSLPGYGTPGGNTETLPFGGGSSGGATNQAPKNQCPSCNASGTLARQGDHYTCSRCGYQEQFGGGNGLSFSDQRTRVRVSSYSTVNNSTTTAVARRAAALLNQEEDQ